MQRSSLYLNNRYRQPAVEYAGNFINHLPAEIGVLQVRRISTNQGTHYMDWQMCYHKEAFVRRKGELAEEEIQVIFFVNRGMDWNIDSRSCPVRMNPGEVCIYLNRDITTSAYYPAEQEFEFRSIQLSASNFKAMLTAHLSDEQNNRILQLLRQEVVKCTATPQMWRLLEEIGQLGQYQGALLSLQLEGKVMEILALCLGEILEAESKTAVSSRPLSVSDLEVIREARQIISQQPAMAGSCQKLARQLGISPSKLNKGFLEIYGITLHAYVIDCRLEQAAALLAGGRCNVSQAAMLSGYSNLSHFSSSFKKKHGILPKEYK